MNCRRQHGCLRRGEVVAFSNNLKSRRQDVRKNFKLKKFGVSDLACDLTRCLHFTWRGVFGLFNSKPHASERGNVFCCRKSHLFAGLFDLS